MSEEPVDAPAIVPLTEPADAAGVNDPPRKKSVFGINLVGIDIVCVCLCVCLFVCVFSLCAAVCGRVQARLSTCSYLRKANRSSGGGSADARVQRLLTRSPLADRLKQVSHDG